MKPPFLNAAALGLATLGLVLWGSIALAQSAAEPAALMPLKEIADSSRFVLSPMPGRVVSIAVAEGDDVKAGQPLAVIDAMKMENVLRAHRDGCIAKIAVGVGDSLSTDQVILEFE